MADADVEVRWEDQVKINEFGRLNAKLKEREGEEQALRKAIEELDDAATELELADGDIKLMLGGESFIDVDEDFARAYCEAEQEKLQTDLDDQTAAIADIKRRQDVLKVELYARFGSNINLEEK